MRRKIAVFAHWDPDGLIDPYVVHYVHELARTCEVVFVSDCELRDEELSKVERVTRLRICGRHGEYDFGSYKRGFLAIKNALPDYDELVFANDSCYGPFSPLEELWEKMGPRECDYWGLFEHHHRTVDTWHIQSFFLVFRRKAFLSEAFDAFISSIQKQKDKESVIINCEVKLSKTLDQAGLVSGSLCPRSNVNLTHSEAAFDLMSEFGMPLLKKALLARNPLRATYLIDRISDLERRTTSRRPFELMMANLERTAPKGYQDHWFHSKLLTGKIFHRKLIRYKEKPTRWMTILKIKILGITIIPVPWKLLVKRIRFDLQNRDHNT